MEPPWSYGIRDLVFSRVSWLVNQSLGGVQITSLIDVDLCLDVEWLVSQTISCEASETILCVLVVFAELACEVL